MTLIDSGVTVAVALVLVSALIWKVRREGRRHLDRLETLRRLRMLTDSRER